MGKYLGQHFLINKDNIRKIVEVLELKDGDVIIEIGPGHGELTEELRIENRGLRGGNKGLKIIAIEKDEELAKDLELRIENLGLKNIEIIKGDILKILPELPQSSILNPQSYKIVGNIPYYITGYLLRILGELKNKPSLIVLTIQKEVAERVCAFRQSYEVRLRKIEKMNLLAASVQFWAKPEIVDFISKKDFQPAPEVDSAIIKLKVKSEGRKVNSYEVSLRKIENYYKFIKILFKQPRKTISNNLINIGRSDLPKIDVNIRRSDLQKLLKEIDINPDARPQDLSIEQIIELSTLF